jgi:hypothetical protein
MVSFANQPGDYKDALSVQEHSCTLIGHFDWAAALAFHVFEVLVFEVLALLGSSHVYRQQHAFNAVCQVTILDSARGCRVHPYDLARMAIHISKLDTD